MKLRLGSLVVALTLALLAAPLGARAQQPGKVSRIGFLGNSTAALEANLVGPFRESLRELKYTEGQNLLITTASTPAPGKTPAPARISPSTGDVPGRWAPPPAGP